MGVRSELSLRLLRVDHRRGLRRLVAWMKASTGTSHAATRSLDYPQPIEHITSASALRLRAG
jgi:hypothetical protein